MDDNMLTLSTVDRPASISLMKAIEDVIEEVAVGKVTPIELVGVLHMVASGYIIRGGDSSTST